MNFFNLFSLLRGWSLGGIFNKFSLKPKNQMILPDDKNPTVCLIMFNPFFRVLFS